MVKLTSIPLTLVAALFFSGNGHAYNPPPYSSDQNAQYNTVIESYVTPHIRWAKPYLGGRPRVLILAPRWGMREAVELMQRMDMDAAVFAVNSNKELGMGMTPGENEVWEGFSFNSRLHEYEKLLKERWDAIILAGFDVKVLPFIPETSALLNKVNEGMGLLIMPDMGMNIIAPAITHNDTQARDRILYPVPVEDIPVMKVIGREKLLYVTEYGKGRIANLKVKGGFRGCFTNDVSDPVYFEYCLALVIRTVMWVTEREPDLEISNVEWQKSFEVSAQNKIRFTIDPRKSSGMAPCINILRPGQCNLPEAFVQKDTVVSGRNGNFEFEFPELSEGRYFFNIHLGSESGRSTWYSGSFAVISDAGIDSVTTGRECYKRGETVNGQVFLKGKIADGSTVTVTLTDGFGRLLLRNIQKVIPGKNTLPFSFPLKDVLHNTLKLQADLRVNGKMVSSKKREFYAPAEGQDDFMFVMWDYGAENEDYVTRRLSERLWDDFHVDAIDLWLKDNNLRALMRANVRPLPYVTRYIFEKVDPTDTAPVRNPSLSDPQYLKKERDQLLKYARMAKDFSPVGYSLGDENNLDDAFSHIRGIDIDFHPASQDSFRNYLKGKYDSLEHLNKIWKTSFPSWTDVSPILQVEALRSGQYARWIDFREFMEHSMTGMHKFGRDVIREVDPNARVGFDGTNVQNSYHGYNFYDLFTANKLQNIYDQPEQREFLRCFAGKDALTGIWLGSYWAHRSEEQNRHYPWLMLLHGMNSCWYWTVYGSTSTGHAMTALAPDLTPAFHFEWALEEIKEIKSGIGKLIMNSERRQDGIAVHYSPSSLHASSLDNTMSFVPFAQMNVVTLLEDAGFQYDFTASPQIEEGILDSGKYKALVLPCSQVITEKEEKSIRKFVDKGGLLIADVRPGFYGHFGNPSEKGVLDDLFGIGRTNGGRTHPADLSVSGTIGGRQERFFIPKRSLDGATTAGEGKPLTSVNSIPAIIINKHGKGHTVLFNFDLSDYWGTQPIPLVYALPPQGTLREKGADDGLRQLIRSCMHSAGIEPRVIIETGSGEIKATETMEFSEGDNRYLGILRSHETENLEPQTAQIKLPSVSHVYNARNGAYYGKTDTVTEMIRPARALLFSLMPYRVEGINIEIPKQVSRGAYLPLSFTIKTGGGKPGLHVIHIELRDPQGSVKPWYSMNLLAPSGKAEAKVPFAMNDQAGMWSLKARDAATGCQSEAVFTVK
ncbi:MAG: beta-galactosidase [Candidatus Latescibacter sp.]|nr:beta-galactosidase [Candidatus Latescibacter sp.]